MKVNISNFEKSSRDLFELLIVQDDVSGGVTSKEQIDTIQKYPNAKSLMISGLNQDSFEYLIKRYGEQFKAISFWKNKLVCDLSPLGDLSNLEYIHYFFNQKATGLWDMKNNESLRGLALYDFSKLHTIEKIATAPKLEYFAIGNRVWSKMVIESLKPLVHSSVLHFAWWGNKILDNDYMCLAQSNIKEIDMSIKQFKMEELAKIVASIPDLKGKITKPYTESCLIWQNEKTTCYHLCKGKKSLLKGRDDGKLEKYLADFNCLVEGYKETRDHVE